MDSIVSGDRTPEELHFQNMADFEDCMIRGGEVVFAWKNAEYGVFKLEEDCYLISLSNGDHPKRYPTPSGVLEYELGGNRLRDIITKVTVLERTL